MSPGPAVNTPAMRAVLALLAADAAAAAALGASATPALLLSGPPGVGKTFAVRQAASQTSTPLHVVSPGPHPAARIEAAFAAAAASPTPRALVFLDELDAICPASSANSTASISPPRAVAVLSALLDPPPLPRRVISSPDPAATVIVVVAATNRPAAIHPSLLRPPRLARHIALVAPTPSERVALLRELLPPAQREGAVALAAGMPAAVIADLCAVSEDAVGDHTNSSAGTASSMDESNIPATALLRAAGAGAPTSTAWADIVGATAAKTALQRAVEWPAQNGATLRALGIRPTRGVLLHGPPGAAKTALVRAAATAAKLPFFSLASADIYSPFLGEAERALRDAFANARAAAPSVLFLDEIDGLVGRRGFDSTATGADVRNRVLSALLTEMDGVSALGDVLVVAATNRIDCVDDALLRPGRFDEVVQVGLPDREERLAILQMYAAKLPLGRNVQLENVAQQTEGWSGARLKALCSEAGLAALRECGSDGLQSGEAGDVCVEIRHFVV